jgi:hypothetical protein
MAESCRQTLPWRPLAARSPLVRDGHATNLHVGARVREKAAMRIRTDGRGCVARDGELELTQYVAARLLDQRGSETKAPLSDRHEIAISLE